MPDRITDPAHSTELQTKLEEVIKHTKQFSLELHHILQEHNIDIACERAATVEVLKVILQKWVIEIIHVLFIEGQLRFNDVKRNLEGISSRTLTAKLRVLEDTGFIKRLAVSERPTIIEYGLTEKGTILAELSCPIILYLKLEGLKNE